MSAGTAESAGDPAAAPAGEPAAPVGDPGAPAAGASGAHPGGPPGTGAAGAPGPRGDGPEGAAPDAPGPFGALAPVTPTGVADVDAALAMLAMVRGLPAGEHTAVYERAHAALRDSLARLDA